MEKLKTSERLLASLAEAVEWVKTLSPQDAARLHDAQRASLARSITDYPKPSYQDVNGVRVYASWPASSS